MNDDFNVPVSHYQNTNTSKQPPDFKVTTYQEDIMIPFIKIIQNLSDEMISGKDKYNSTLKVGDLYDSLTKTIFKNPQAIICGMRKYYAEWTPQVRGRLIAKHSDDSDIVKNAIKQERITSDGSIAFTLKTQSGNDLLESYGTLLVIKNEDGLILPGRFTFSRSSFIIGKELNTVLSIYQSGGIPLFNLTTNLTSNTKGSWYKPVFTFAGYETDINVINFAKKLSMLVDETILK